MHFKDLERCDHHPGPLDQASWKKDRAGLLEAARKILAGIPQVRPL